MALEGAALLQIVARRLRGLPVSCGVSATHLMLNQNDVENYRTFAKLSPPLRREEDRLALIAGVADGTIDVVVSGHNPQNEEAKRQPFAQAAYGTVGVETLLAGLLSLHHADGVPLDILLRCVTARPATLLGLEGGTLSVGAAADFAITDIDAPWVVEADALRSKSQNAAIDKRKVQGQVLACYVGGEAVFEL